MDEVLLTPGDVARRLLISDSTVRRWLQQGRLKGFKAGGQWRIRYGDLSAFMHRRGHPADQNNGTGSRLFDRATTNPVLPALLLDLLAAVYDEGDHTAIADWQDLLKCLERGHLPSADSLRSDSARALVSGWRVSPHRLAA